MKVLMWATHVGAEGDASQLSWKEFGTDKHVGNKGGLLVGRDRFVSVWFFPTRSSKMNLIHFHFRAELVYGTLFTQAGTKRVPPQGICSPEMRQLETGNELGAPKSQLTEPSRVLESSPVAESLSCQRNVLVDIKVRVLLRIWRTETLQYILFFRSIFFWRSTRNCLKAFL